jgi:hypothetical protein
MKWIKYLFNTPAEDGTDNLFSKALPYSEEALRIAEEEAYNGEYTIEEDGQAEPEVPAEDDLWAELAAAIREGVNEA